MKNMIPAPALWLVPTHGPRLQVFNKFAESFAQRARDLDLMAITTYSSEIESLKSFVDHAVALDWFFSIEDIDTFVKCKSIINVKKLLALQIVGKCGRFNEGIFHADFEKQECCNRIVRSNYRYVVVTDDEVELESVVSYQNFDPSIVKYGMHPTSGNLNHIVFAPLLLIHNVYKRHEAYKFLLEEKSPYGWFSNPPVYESEHLEEFFNFYSLQSFDDFLKLTFNSFDFNLYLLFLRLEKPEIFDKRVLIYRHWPSPNRVIGSFWEWGYISRKIRKLLSEDAKVRSVLWLPAGAKKNRLIQLEVGSKQSNALIYFHTDRNYSNRRRGGLIVRLLKDIFSNPA